MAAAPELIGRSPAWLETLEHVSRAALVDRPILVIGERGTGKELIAERLHFLSPRWEKPFVTAFSDGDPITRGGDAYVQRKIPGAVGRAHRTVSGGHFLQEDSPAELAQAVLELGS